MCDSEGACMWCVNMACFHSSPDPVTQRGSSLLVLCEQELLAFDLDAPK